MSDEQERTTTDEQTQETKRQKSNRASSKANKPEGKSKPEPTRKTTQDGKPIQKTASGFTIVG